MDLVYSCKEKLSYFRIKELKDVLTQLGLSKQGKKQELLNRILENLADEQVSRSHGWGKKGAIRKEVVAKTIDNTYRTMKSPGASGAAEVASKSHGKLDLDYGKPEEVEDDAAQLDLKVRCPCGSTLMSDSMIMCEDPRCRVWQHVACVLIPEKHMDGFQPEIPSCFYCELCRINKADPFWLTVRHPLPPVKLTSSVITSDGTNTRQNVDVTFLLSGTDKELLQRSEYGLQVWCLLLNDKVPFRMQWPQYAELLVNGILVQAINRPGSQLLGINGRDDISLISAYSTEGINRICLSNCDTRIFCFGVRLAMRRTVEQVLNMVPKEVDGGEQLEDALARVRRCIGGGTATENADSDSDLEVVADSITVNLRCPMSGSRMRVAGRFKPCIHMGCFDLETFVELNQRSRKWQCPICLKNYSLENIIIDPYFNRITSLLRNYESDVHEIEVKPDGSWRVKNDGGCQDLSRWHYPDSSLCVTTNAEVKPEMEISRQTKQEGSSEGRTGLKLGMKRNRDGRWEVKKPEDTSLSSAGNSLLDIFENHLPNIRPRSSTATGSYRDGEDASVNQDGGNHLDSSVNNGHEIDSLPLNFDTAYNIEGIAPHVSSKDSDIIVLSDSEEDVPANSAATGNETNRADGPGLPFDANHPGVHQRCSEDTGLVTSGTSCLGLFYNGGDDFGIPFWPLQTDTGFQPFEMGSNAPDSLVDAQGSLACAPTISYDLASNSALGDMSSMNFSTCHSDPETNGSLVDNPLSFSGNDPSLQIFLPSRPASVVLQSDFRDNNEMPSRVQSDDWMPLTLAAGGHSNSASTSGLNPRRTAPVESRMETLVNNGSIF